MIETLKKFKSFWLIELLLLLTGFYLIYDGFLADNAKFHADDAPADSNAVTTAPVKSKPAVTSSKTALETAVVCLDIDAVKKKPLVPKGRFSKYIDRLYCFTEISGALPDVLIHDWVYEGKQTYRQRIKIGNETKVWSQMEMSPDKAGTWRVDIFTGDGTFLDSADFVLK